MSNGRIALYVVLAAVCMPLAGCTITYGLFDAQSTRGVERRAGGGCAAPLSTYNLPIDGGVLLTIKATGHKHVTRDNEFLPSALFIRVVVRVPTGQRVKFEDTTFRVSSPDFEGTKELHLAPFYLSVQGIPSDPIGYAITFSPMDELIGGHQKAKELVDQFGSTMIARGVIPKKFTLQFPSFLVNGTRVKPAPVTFVYREETHFACFFS